MKPETIFRNNSVMPFLRKIPNCYKVSIQQVALRGIPDLLIGLNSIFIGMELKKLGGKPMPMQIYNLKKIDEAGCLAMLVDPGSWKEDKEVLRSIAAAPLRDVVSLVHEVRPSFLSRF